MENELSPDEPGEQPKRKRGRPPGNHKVKYSVQDEQHTNKPSSHEAQKTTRRQKSSPQLREPEEEYEAYRESGTPAAEEKLLTPFSALLHSILWGDRAEITRIAHELEVAENSVYRWMSGSTEPRIAHLKRLPDVLPEQRTALIHAINQTFGLALEMPTPTIHEVRKEVYQRVIELVATSDDAQTRFWLVSQAIFEYALIHLDLERRGMAITFAKLLPPQADGTIHTLREVGMRGTDPWPFSIESKGYLGSTTLAGAAVGLQRLQIWNITDGNTRTQVAVDQFERSACAVPVMRGNLIAGALIVSSTLPGFFHDPTIRQAIGEYARMMGVALSDTDFYPFTLVHLRPLPDLAWQRAQMAQSYGRRVLAYARQYALSRRAAELLVQGEFEREFEEFATMQIQEKNQGQQTEIPMKEQNSSAVT